MNIEQDADTKDGLNYGLDEKRTTAYIRAMEDVLERGRIIGQHTLTRRKEL